MCTNFGPLIFLALSKTVNNEDISWPSTGPKYSKFNNSKMLSVLFPLTFTELR